MSRADARGERPIDGGVHVGAPDCSVIVVDAAMSAMRPATACAIFMLRSGGYAACEADSHPRCPCDPPTRDA
eukprot:5468385-Pleurochrysis_carterae.AAC.2